MNDECKMPRQERYDGAAKVVSKDVPNMLESLEKSTARLIENAKVLSDRLQPFLQAQCENNGETGEAVPMCEFASYIRSQNDKVRIANGILEDILERIQI